MLMVLSLVWGHITLAGMLYCHLHMVAMVFLPRCSRHGMNPLGAFTGAQLNSPLFFSQLKPSPN